MLPKIFNLYLNQSYNLCLQIRPAPPQKQTGSTIYSLQPVMDIHQIFLLYKQIQKGMGHGKLMPKKLPKNLVELRIELRTFSDDIHLCEREIITIRTFDFGRKFH